jgi:hypothetical protein
MGRNLSWNFNAWMKKSCARIPIWFWLLLFCGIALGQVYFLRDVVMGDAFIHFVFARGIAEGQPFFYNGEFSAGSTSPLWSALLAPFWKIFGMKIIWMVKILAGFFVALSIPLTFVASFKVSKNRNLSLIAAALIATSFVFSFWAAKGMETPFYVCLVLLSFIFYLRILELEKSLTLEIALGILLGLGILTRPEMWFFSLFIGIPLLMKKGWRVIFSVGILAFLVFSPYYIWLYENTGQIFPSSVARILRARQWAIEWNGVFFTLEIFKILLAKFLLLTPFFLFFFWRREKINRFVFYPIFAWLTFHVIFFSIIFPTTEGYRYLLAALPFFFLISVLGIFRLPKKWQTPILIFAIVGSCLISGQQFLERRDSIENCEKPFIDKTRREVGIWIHENTPPESLIAMKEIDQSAFYGERRMLSLDGTLDTRAMEFVKSGNQLQFLKNERPNFFILEEEMYREYPDWQNSNLLQLADPNSRISEIKILNGVNFELLKKIKSGDAESCSNFSDEYFWWIFEVKYF